MDTAKMVLNGSPARLVTPTDTVTASQSIEYDERAQQAVARGDAVASRADRRIRADVLTARFKEDARGRLVLKRADAVGGVLLTTARDVVTGDKGDYDAESGIATLTGSVKITRDKNQLNGGYAQVNLNTGISKLFAAAPGSAGGGQRVQGLFVPEGDAPAGAAGGGQR
jgi:lipopolysaccharide export system protein LptA